MFDAHILTLFPNSFPGPLALSLVGKALEAGLWRLTCYNLRDFSADKRVDDTPFGGGAGMVMRADILAKAIDTIRAQVDLPIVYFTPRGKRLEQTFVQELVNQRGGIFVCGRFEGVDERLLQRRPIIQVSLGDFILSGGEIATMATLEAAVRLLPGVVGNAQSLEDESFVNNLLEYPHYTRPLSFEGDNVPPILLSGHHARIKAWRLRKAQELTQHHRPDLWEKYVQNHLDQPKKM